MTDSFVIKFDFINCVWYITIPTVYWDINCKIREYIKVEQKKKFNFRELLRWDNSVKKWIATDASYPVILDLMRYCKNENIFYMLTQEAVEHIQMLEAYDARASWGTLDLQPTEDFSFLKSKLRNYQYTGIKFCDSAEGNVLVGLGVGTGKTLIALGWCEWRNKKAIIICPSQKNKTKRSWAREIAKHTHSTSIILYSASRLDLAKIIQHRYIIINYELLNNKRFKALLPLLAGQGGYDTLIVDESHNIKNARTNRYKDIQYLSHYCKHRILLSATAIKNRPMELYTQLNIVMPARFNNALDFKYRYCTNRARKNKHGIMFVPKRSKEQAAMLNRDIGGVYFYRDKYSIIKELPPLTINIEWYDLDSMEQYTDLEKQMAGGELEYLAGRHRQHMLLANMMIPNTIEYIKDHLITDDNKKIIAYSGFRETTEKLGTGLGDIAVWTHGGLNQKDSDTVFAKFLKDDDIRCIAATYQSFSESINLQDVANVVVFNDCPYVPGSIEQAWGRVHRLGQTHPCIVKILGFEDTYFEEIQEIVENKAEIVMKVLENKELEEFLNQEIK